MFFILVATGIEKKKKGLLKEKCWSRKRSNLSNFIERRVNNLKRKDRANRVRLQVVGLPEDKIFIAI